MLASFARPADPRLEGNSAEQTGFNAKRLEFDPDFDTDAELPLADMDFRAEDTPEEVRAGKQSCRNVSAGTLVPEIKAPRARASGRVRAEYAPEEVRMARAALERAP